MSSSEQMPTAFLANIAPLHVPDPGGAAHARTEYRAWTVVVPAGDTFSEPLEAAQLYLVDALKRIGVRPDKAQADADQAKEFAKSTTLTVNGVDYDGVELSVFVLKARAAVVDGGWTVVVVAPDGEQPTVTVQMP